MTARIEEIYDDLEDLFEYIVLLLSEKGAVNFNQIPSANSWSVVQVVQHCYGVENGVFKWMEPILKGKANLGRSFFRSKGKRLLLQFAFALPIRWRAPKSMGEPNNLESYEEVMNQWILLRKNMKRELNPLKKKDLSLLCFQHPSVGYMNIEDTLLLMRMHLSRHIHQIKNLIS
jgi:hypothetical protein